MVMSSEEQKARRAYYHYIDPLKDARISSIGRAIEENNTVLRDAKKQVDYYNELKRLKGELSSQDLRAMEIAKQTVDKSEKQLKIIKDSAKYQTMLNLAREQMIKDAERENDYAIANAENIRRNLEQKVEYAKQELEAARRAGDKEKIAEEEAELQKQKDLVEQQKIQIEKIKEAHKNGENLTEEQKKNIDRRIENGTVDWANITGHQEFKARSAGGGAANFFGAMTDAIVKGNRGQNNITGTTIRAAIANGLGDLNVPLWMNKALSIISNISDVVIASRDVLDSMVTNAASVISKYWGVTNARLEGSGVKFSELLDTANDYFGGSTLVTQEEYLANIASLTSQGISFNVEQRAILSTIANKTVPTFEVMNSTLQRFVRLYKEDMSQPFMGLEEVLKVALNRTFQDSTYLNSLYDSVMSAMENVSSLQSTNGLVTYNSTAQTWLASMYEAGISESTVSTIASILDALGSGNVNSLSGNTTAQNLLLLSMDKIGMDYADILQNGLDAGTTNSLMKAIVDYLSEIADNTDDNNVLASAYTNIFGISMADLQGIKNLGSMTSSIYNSATTNTSTALTALNAAVQAVDENTYITEKIDNIIANTKFDFGSSIADNSAQYLSWKAAMMYENIYSEILSISTVDSDGSTSNAFSGFMSKALKAGKTVADFAILGNTLLGVLETSVDLISGFSGYVSEGNTVADALDFSIVTNDYSGMKGVNTRSKWATYSNKAGTRKGATYNQTNDEYNSQFKSLYNNDTDYTETTSDDWKTTTASTTDLLNNVVTDIESMMVQQTEDETHKALAVFLTGLTDATLRSFASIFADEEALGLTTEDSNTAYKLTLFNYADSEDSATQTATANTASTTTTATTSSTAVN